MKSLRVGQFSAFFGDRDDGARQLVDAGVDVLVGDYLAELTMLILRKNQLRGRPGYASTFLAQIDDVLGEVSNEGIKVVVNAGGLDPLGCAKALRQRVRELQLDLRVAAVVGDNIIDAIGELQSQGERFEHIDSGEPLAADSSTLLTANAYLGAWPIVEALRGGADIVICPRVTDASLIMGPVAWHFGWAVTDWDRLAGALVAGHIIECGAQATGGNFSLFDRFDDLGLPGMPIAEVNEDGSSTITKAGEGGLVTTDSISAQLLYEIGSPLYENPDVLVDFTSIRLQQDGRDRVIVHPVRGFAPSDSCKVSMALEGGYRNTIQVGITGGRTDDKVAWLLREVERAIGAPDSFDDFRVTVVGARANEAGTYDDTTAIVVLSVLDTDRSRVGRAGFSTPITKIAVSNIPGFYLTAPPGGESMVGRYWPTLVPKSALRVQVVGEDGIGRDVPWTAPHRDSLPIVSPFPILVPQDDGDLSDFLIRDVAGTRSGDKGGKANLGVWTAPPLYPWLARTLTVEKVKELIPELQDFDVNRYELPNLYGLNFVIDRWLGDGVASCLRLDGQAKGLGEQLGAQVIRVPGALVDRTLLDWPVQRTSCRTKRPPALSSRVVVTGEE